MMPEHYNYECFRFSQRVISKDAPEFCLFHAPVGEVLQWSRVDRLEDKPGGVQRSQNDSRIKAIKRFMDDPANTIPTAIVIAFPKNSCVVQRQTTNTTTISISCRDTNPESSPGILDGQHRLLGLSHYDHKIQVPIVGIINCELSEMRFQFLVINNKASRVSTDHIRALVADTASDSLKERLLRARINLSPRMDFIDPCDTDPNSPFYQLINWPKNRHGEKIVPPAAIEMAFKLLQDFLIPEFENNDVIIEYFFAIWRCVRAEWPSIWKQDSSLLTKVGIPSLTFFLAEAMVKQYDTGELDVANLDDVTQHVTKRLRLLHPDFWTTTWSGSGYDTEAGRKLVHESLTTISRNIARRRDWREGVACLE